MFKNFVLKRIIFCAALLLFIGAAKAQQPGDSTYEIYRDQLKKLFVTRGMVQYEIDSILVQYRQHNITSHENFAKTLGTLYPANAGIGVLFYFFNNDTLSRIFFEPGAIKEVKSIPIKKTELLQLSADLNHALRLYSLTKNRAPRMRGAAPLEEEKNVSFPDVIKKTTRLLLPDAFDTGYKHLLVIPALNIGVIPFALLQPYTNQTKHLVDYCSVTIVPSPLDLIALRSRVLKEAGVNVSEALGEGDRFNTIASRRKYKFSFDNALFVSNPSYPKNTKYIFPNLPGAQAEIDTAVRYAKNFRRFGGKAAIKDSILANMSGKDLVYFATHGISDEVDPMGKSFLVLSGDVPFLTAQELMNLRFEKRFVFPEMVILSACQTGLGKFMEAGVAGLARPFLIGGSRSVIMSLWSVDDAATAYLMNRFLYYLQQPDYFMPAQQLRQSILDTKKRFPHPSLWASFTVFGIDY